MAYEGMTDRNRIEAEMPWEERDLPVTLYGLISRTTEKFPQNNAVSYQIFSGPKDKAETFNWTQLKDKTTQNANLFRSLDVGPKDVVAYILPNCNEAVLSLLGGGVAGIANPINPLLDEEQIGAILRETGAKVVVTLRAFPKTDVAEKTAAAVALAPNVKTVLEVDLLRYVSPPKSWIIPLIRPKMTQAPGVEYKNFNTELNKRAFSICLKSKYPLREDNAKPNTSRTVGTPLIDVGIFKSTASRRMIVSCCQSFSPKNATSALA